MKRTLQSLIGSVLVASNLSGCGYNKSYLLTQERVDEIYTFAVHENKKEIEKYTLIKSRLEEGKFDEVKLLISVYLEEERRQTTIFINFLKNDQRISDKTKEELKKIAEEDLKKVENELGVEQE
ncbi:hypothetical protein HYX16_01095 [Candidatus Woesearchaeota archaeon]|nr:hypothetical protein [Candidatus Woesearchaeota archaeon]